MAYLDKFRVLCSILEKEMLVTEQNNMEKLMVLIASSDNIMYNYKEMHEVFPFVKVNTLRKSNILLLHIIQPLCTDATYGMASFCCIWISIP